MVRVLTKVYSIYRRILVFQEGLTVLHSNYQQTFGMWHVFLSIPSEMTGAGAHGNAFSNMNGVRTTAMRAPGPGTALRAPGTSAGRPPPSQMGRMMTGVSVAKV